MISSLRSFKPILLAVAVCLVLPAALQAQDAGEKIKVEDLSELPVQAYPLAGSVTDLINSKTEFSEFAAKVRNDLEQTLARYQIEDVATLQGYISTLLTLDMIDGRYDDAKKKIVKVRKLEDKEALKLTTGLTASAIMAAHEAGEPGSNAYRQAFEDQLRQDVEELPWDVVQDRVQQIKGNLEIISENLIMGMVQSQLDPVVAKSGELSSDLARRVINLYFALDQVIPLKQEQLNVYAQYISQHQVEKTNIWPERDVELAADLDLQPVVIAVWDAGVDAPVFGELMWMNKAEILDGKDTDDNGYVDDIHGIAYDVDGNKTPDLLHPHGDQEGKVEAAMSYLKGLMDLQAALDTEEATALKKYLGGLPPEKMEDFMTSLSFCGMYAHGTHVAGIAIEGNPFARVLGARITFDYHTIPQPMTKELAKKHAQSYHDAVAYFQAHGVRVANMSWGWTYKEIESILEANGIGDTTEKRQQEAKEILGILDDGLYNALKSAPEILFVSAAGNSDSDVAFDKVIPSSYELPNLLIVGAVDQAGERTAFTSSGENVVVYANGFEVMSYVPGGKKMAMSGTSMSSPNAANLAAKLIAVKPDLTPEQVITIIKESADSLAEQPDLLLMNPKAALSVLQKQS